MPQQNSAELLPARSRPRLAAKSRRKMKICSLAISEPFGSHLNHHGFFVGRFAGN